MVAMIWNIFRDTKARPEPYRAEDFIKSEASEKKGQNKDEQKKAMLAWKAALGKGN